MKLSLRQVFRVTRTGAGYILFSREPVKVRFAFWTGNLGASSVLDSSHFLELGRKSYKVVLGCRAAKLQLPEFASALEMLVCLIS